MGCHAAIQLHCLLCIEKKNTPCQFQRQSRIPLAYGFDFQCQNTSLWKPLLFCKCVCQGPCSAHNGFTKRSVLLFWHLERRKFLNGKKDQVAVLHPRYLLPTYCATVLEARFHNYIVPTHNYPQLV